MSITLHLLTHATEVAHGIDALDFFFVGLTVNPYFVNSLQALHGGEKSRGRVYVGTDGSPLTFQVSRGSDMIRCSTDHRFSM